MPRIAMGSHCRGTDDHGLYSLLCEKGGDLHGRLQVPPLRAVAAGVQGFRGDSGPKTAPSAPIRALEGPIGPQAAQ